MILNLARTEKPDFENDEIVVIAYQQIDSRTGEKKGRLSMLKSWESSELEVLRSCHELMAFGRKWDFVPIGFNLSFDFASLLLRWRKMGIQVNARMLFSERPYIDMQHVLLLCNSGSFSGCTLERFAGKKHSGKKVSEWLNENDYRAVEAYVEDEAERFIELYRFLVSRLPGVWSEFGREQGLVV